MVPTRRIILVLKGKCNETKFEEQPTMLALCFVSVMIIGSWTGLLFGQGLCGRSDHEQPDRTDAVNKIR